VKSVAFREKDSNVMREAIQEDIRTEQWASAGVLIDALEERFGCTEEAEQFRAALRRHRQASTEEKIDSAVQHVESMWMIHRYDEALRESEKLARLYPQNEKVNQLREKTEVRRQAHKKELLARWDEAVKKHDFEQGVELLKLLDNYLTASEAAALEETAREVFRGKLQNYGVQFTMFVTEKQWAKALEVGRKIIEEFPNTRIAQEVREKLDILAQRARQPQTS
jgi:tetratricopeptide (TPR) repeat protein